MAVFARSVYDYGDSVDYKTFLSILNRPDGFKPAGTPGKCFGYNGGCLGWS